MYSRWYSVAVVLLWLATMTWLITQKVLPALLVGEPPNYRTILEAGRDDLVVGWRMTWDGRPLGWALNTRTPLPQGMTEVQSRIHFTELPLQDLTPDWLHGLLDPKGQLPVELQMDVKSTLVFDSLGQLSRFESSAGFQAMEALIKVRGMIDAGELTLSVRSGDFTYQPEPIPFAGRSMLSDALSPQTHLPGLREGQTWTVKVYSPLRPPSGPLDPPPLDILEAEVVETERIHWDGQQVDTWHVVYRVDRGAQTGRDRNPRGEAWVRCGDGTVLKQKATVFNSTLIFVRLPDEPARALAASAGYLPQDELHPR